MNLFMVSRIYHHGEVQAKAGEWHDLKEGRGKEYELVFREVTKVPDDKKTLLYVRNEFQIVFLDSLLHHQTNLFDPSL